MTVALVWLRRNLRLDDNRVLDAALRAADAVVPVHVLEEDDAPLRRAFRADALEALAEGLEKKGGRLVVRNGPAGDALAALAREVSADAVFTHGDHEPRGKELLEDARRALSAQGTKLHLVEDLLLLPPSSLATENGKPFTVFAPFSRRWLEADKPAPLPEPARVPAPAAVRSAEFPTVAFESARNGPRAGSAAARVLWDAFLSGGLAAYAEDRDRPDRDGTSRLSPHLRLGTIGIRRVLAEARTAWRELDARGRRGAETFVKELSWREFYAGVLDRVPSLAEENLRREFDAFPWVTGEEEERIFAAWAAGRTGYAIVDAGMRQLAAEGWIHNRVRMIVASFLAKDLLVDWRKGEAHFRRLLLDADAASNAGGWQWAAGTGTDAQPFFRVFNPTLQGARFDPDGAYVRRWVPEDEAAVPIVDHAQARRRALAAFEEVKARAQGAAGTAASRRGTGTSIGKP